MTTEGATSAMELAQRALDSADQFLVAAEAAIPALGAALRAGEIDAARPDLRLLLGGIESIVHLAGDLDRMDRAAAPVIAFDDLADVIRAVVAGQERSDWVAVADVLETSLAARLPGWRAALASRR